MIQILICKYYIKFCYSPIDVSIPHSDDKVMISFGTTLKRHACDESFGIDDVMIYIK